VVKIQYDIKISYICLLDYLHHGLGFSKYERGLKFDKRDMWGNINILLKGGDIN
jgi:hypothetical protein